MKMKTWHLFLVIIILFGCSYYVVNLKFDKFYRVNGINNDNRVLIEKYLSEDEQTYLIDNQISIDLFIEYIEEDAFQLSNYQYYNYLKASKHYTQVEDILNVGNSLATRLTYLYKDQAFAKAKVLIDQSLETAFLSEENFSFDFINLYANMKKIYPKDDFSYIADTEAYVEKLKTIGVRKNEIEHTFEMFTKAYSKEALDLLFKQQLAADVKYVFNPYELSTIVDQYHYIGEYEPIDLLLIQDIPRMRYAMYLQSDAYHALIKMYQDLNQNYSGFLLREAFVGAQSIDEKEIGYREEQLGLTITVTQSETAYEEFQNTEMSKWLEKHAHEYGFVLRYPRDKASVTNHKYDAHTYRYVGKSLAKSLKESALTLEEYHLQNR